MVRVEPTHEHHEQLHSDMGKKATLRVAVGSVESRLHIRQNEDDETKESKP